MMATLQDSNDSGMIDWFDDRQSKHWYSSRHAHFIEQVTHCDSACTDRKKTILLSFAGIREMLEPIQFESTNDSQRIGRVSQSRRLLAAQPCIMIDPRNLTIRHTKKRGPRAQERHMNDERRRTTRGARQSKNCIASTAYSSDIARFDYCESSAAADSTRAGCRNGEWVVLHHHANTSRFAKGRLGQLRERQDHIVQFIIWNQDRNAPTARGFLCGKFDCA